MSYIEKTLALGLALKGGVHHIGVFHDSWCQIYSGGDCNCDAEVRVLDGPPPASWAADFRRRCREKRRAARGGAHNG